MLEWNNDLVSVARDEAGVVHQDGPDSDLSRRIARFLNARRVPSVSSLDIEVDGETVVIRGRLPSLQTKWLCVECCRRVAGVRRLIDLVEVR